MGFQSTGIGRLCSWDRSSAGGLDVLFAGVGFFCGTAGGTEEEEANTSAAWPLE